MNFGVLAFETGMGPSTDISLDLWPNITGHNKTLGGSYSGMQYMEEGVKNCMLEPYWNIGTEQTCRRIVGY